MERQTCLTIDSLSPTHFPDDAYFDISDFEPIEIGEFSHYGQVHLQLIQQEKHYLNTKQEKYRYPQPKTDVKAGSNQCFINMMLSHSAIYSAFCYVTRKRISIVPSNLLDVLAVKSTSYNVLLNQEQKSLLWINDRKLPERVILIDAILQEPGLNDTWIAKLNAMKTQK
ncbi:hypothetical protein SS50377_25788 [Spironucleus salmonicida]|uniref:Uncharacterized protein n=1 Tax=Spironucleus salmonicida TaxID=348837 RepID=V6LX04_9EUKA|nr:hypothetical protein SS50377_25788 [Spironucleus salmonicida]|eukprot:EST48236.1 Hypothetical protein SS50377_11578 [Spironucleus salmonicida]